ncbi:C-type lectin domain family 4 member A-like isoform X1 [Mastomys coucha]|uniref:C-type lectin domain family 4 member A-like isoform X1 n=1 Tax=Mastomys coucha TaxID=35658 RepID=UPI0012626CD6|nr:C-type lectin domain family 4 member A-like isoform X1 [Mastomys coucha]
MALPNIYTDVNFKNQPFSSGITSDSSSCTISDSSSCTISNSSSALPKKTTIHKSNPGFPTLLLALWIFFLLLAISFSVALIILFQMYSNLLEEKNTLEQLNHAKLHCVKNHSSVEAPSSNEDKVWSCCPKNWKPFGSQCYFTSRDSASWSKSEEKCSLRGAHLLVIHSQEEQDFITNSLNPRATYYVGLSDPEGHGQWQWVDQTPYNPNATSWHSDEPSGSTELCVVLSYHPNVKGWGWSVAPCDGDHRLVCEMRQLYL